MEKNISKGYISNARRYTLINYLEVWTDGEGGWTVNNSCVEFDDLYIKDDASNKEILTYLYNAGYLATNDMRKVRIDDYSDGFEIYQVKGWKPLFAIIPTVICDESDDEDKEEFISKKEESRYNLMAYNKDRDIYNLVSSSDNKEELENLAQSLIPVLREDLFRDETNEPYDWLELWDSEDDNGENDKIYP